MKLTITPSIAPYESSKLSHSPKSRREDGFDRVLAETMEEQSSGSGEHVHSAGLLGSVAGVGPEWICRETIEFDFEQLIEGLDIYREKLNNPGYTLKDIESDLQAVNTLKKKLTDRMETLPDNHPIKALLNEGLIVASTEIERFYRGEYC